MSTEPVTHLEQVVAGTTTPVTHLEQVVAGTATPVTHLEHVISENSGGGSATLIEKTVTQNGVYNAADDSADGYSKVAANVPNTYAAGDEGKVVSSGALVAQSSDTVTQNGTVDTTLINSLTVNVPTKDYEAGDWLDVTKPVGVVTSNGLFLDATNKGNLLANRTGITELHLPLAHCVPDAVVYGCVNLEKVTAPNAAFLGATAAYGCKKLKTVCFPSVAYVYSAVFQACTNLESADFGGTPESGKGLWRIQIFDSDTKFGTLVLRGSAVWSLTNINVFGGTKFASGKAGGTLYVPESLISSYQAATNWSTILGYPNNQIKSIESTATDPDAPVDLTTHYIDGTLITA